MYIISGGFMITGLLAIALFGPIGSIFIGISIIGLIAYMCGQAQVKRKRNAWRKAYPSYRY